jgi:hypothetical protein
MTTIDIIGFIGVFILLLAYFLNLANKINNDSLAYLLMNFVGAGIAGLASLLMKYLPFVILEGSWAVVSAVGIFNYFRKNKSS